jgi:hypothetical protein
MCDPHHGKCDSLDLNQIGPCYNALSFGWQKVSGRVYIGIGMNYEHQDCEAGMLKSIEVRGESDKS